MKSYELAWRRWVGWRIWKEINPFRCEINPILEFLGELFVACFQYKRSGTHTSAITLYHNLVEEMKVQVHPKVSAMQEVFNARPPKAKYTFI